MHLFISCGVLLFTSTCLANPLQHRKRYDLDGNGIPDLCWTGNDGIAHCMRSDGSWTAFPASTTSSTTRSSATSSKSSKITVQPSTSSSSYGNSISPALSTSVTTSSRIASTSTSSRSTSTSTSSKTSSPSTSSKSTSKSTESTTTVTTTTTTTTTTTASSAVGTLPAPSQFKTDKGTKWNVEYVGDLQFTGQMNAEHLGGDKGRTGVIGGKVIWNFGDMECNGTWTTCGFSMGAAFYGTSDVMTVNTDNVVNVNDNTFLQPWSGDAQPVAPQTSWGMDTSNVVAINDTHGVAYAWEIWRGGPDGSYVNRGNAVASITLGDQMPIATRLGPLISDGNAIQLGLLAILRDGDYVYTYSKGGPSNLIIGRVTADDSVFDSSKYSFLAHNDTSNSWIPGIPTASTTTIGATTANPSGQFGCDVYGSVFFNTYLRKYVIICSIYLNFVNMYISDTPYGPWSAEYGLMSSNTDQHVAGSYGSMVHPSYGDGNEFYFSMGPNGVFNMFKVNFNY